MDIEVFKKTYTPTMMKLVKLLSQKLEVEIKRDLECDNHHVVLETKIKIDDLAQCKMLLAVYEACPHCFETDCSSDHK